MGDDEGHALRVVKGCAGCAVRGRARKDTRQSFMDTRLGRSAKMGKHRGHLTPRKSGGKGRSLVSPSLRPYPLCTRVSARLQLRPPADGDAREEGVHVHVEHNALHRALHRATTGRERAVLLCCGGGWRGWRARLHPLQQGLVAKPPRPYEVEAGRLGEAKKEWETR